MKGPLITAAQPQLFDRLITEHFPANCAVWLHAALALILASLPPAIFKTDRTLEPVDVEIVTLPARPPQSGSGSGPETGFADFGRQSLLREPAVERPHGTRPAEDRAVRPLHSGLSEPNTPGADWRAPQNWVVAGTMRGAAVLSDPRSAQARRVLTMVTSQDRREQICALEAMEQVRAGKPGFQPDRLVPYALKNTIQKAQLIVAPAGALRSRRNWFEIAYRCTLNGAGTAVERFEYVLGPPIPAKRWDELGLAAVY